MARADCAAGIARAAQSAGVADKNVITTLMPRPLGLSTGGRRLRQSDGQPLLVQTRIASPHPGTTQETLQRSLDSGSLSQQLKQLGWSIASAPARVGVRRRGLRPGLACCMVARGREGRVPLP